MTPDKIYIFDDGDELWYKPEDWETPPPGRVEYIRKITLLAKLSKAKELRLKSGARKYSDGIRVIDAIIEVINKT